MSSSVTREYQISIKRLPAYRAIQLRYTRTAAIVAERLSVAPNPAPLRSVTRDDDHLLQAGAVIVLAVVAARTAVRYQERADRYLAMGLGHAAQNVLLQAEALGLWAYPVGAHDPEGVARLLRLPEGYSPLYMVPVGHPAA